MEVTAEDLAEIQQENRRRLAVIQAQGVAVQVPSAPTSLVEMLIKVVVGPTGSPEWLGFIHAYEVRFQTMLDEVESQIARAKLTAPGPALNGQPHVGRP